MLLKISDGNDGWVLFDKVQRVHLVASKGTSVATPAELAKLGGSDALTLVSRDCFKKGQVLIGTFEFEREGITRKALFTNVVYVCNDKGDTLDRLSVKNGKGGN